MSVRVIDLRGPQIHLPLDIASAVLELALVTDMDGRTDGEQAAVEYLTRAVSAVESDQ
jgi:hypothetical protein